MTSIKTRAHDCKIFEGKFIAIFRRNNEMKISKRIFFAVEYDHEICHDSSTNNLVTFAPFNITFRNIFAFSLSSILVLLWQRIREKLNLKVLKLSAFVLRQ